MDLAIAGAIAILSSVYFQDGKLAFLGILFAVLGLACGRHIRS